MGSRARDVRIERRRWLAAASGLLLVLGAVVGLAVRERALETGPHDGGASEGRAVHGAPPAAQPTLRGLGASDPGERRPGPSGDGPGLADASSPRQSLPPRALAPSAPPGAVLGPLFPIAPGAVEDLVASTAPRPLHLRRTDVVGRVGPYGEREDTGADPMRWIGMASVERDDRSGSEASDDVEQPVTTAVRGVVVGEDDQPILGAEVILYTSFYLRQAFYDHRVRQIGRVFTGADGVFDLRPVDLDTVHFGRDGEVLVTVRHPAFADLVAQALPGILPGQESDVGRLVLPARGATIRGTVLDLAGAPVVGAAIRVSGGMNPIEYDKTERMVVLSACPTAITDEQGRYELSDLAPGLHEISVTIRIDCVLHESRRWTGTCEWSPRVRAGHGVRGRVVDPMGAPVAAAVVAGGGNWTPTNADGTFWLDNVFPGPLTLQVAHHAWHTVLASGVATDSEEVLLAFERPLPRITLEVVDASERPVPLIALDWSWPAPGGAGRFAPDSRYWSNASGRYGLIVPEGAVGGTISDPATGATAPLPPEGLHEGASQRLVLVPPGPGR